METISRHKTLTASLLERLHAGDTLAQLTHSVQRGNKVTSLSGLAAGPARALAVAALQRTTGRRIAIIADSVSDLEDWANDLAFWHALLGEAQAAPARVQVVPGAESDPYAGVSPHAETLEQRALALWQLAQSESDFVVLTARALLQRTVAPKQLIKSGCRIECGQDVAPAVLGAQLFAAGYLREEPVVGVGQYSMRGGIIDVWPPGNEAPLRIEFFGDSVESLREFDADTQLSLKLLDHVALAPMREMSVAPGDFRDWAEFARMRWTDERYARALQDRTTVADEDQSFPGWEWLMPLAHETNASVFDYLAANTLLVIDEPGTIDTNLATQLQTLNARYQESEAADEPALPPDELFLTGAQLREALGRFQRIELRALGQAAARTDDQFTLEVDQPAIAFGKVRDQVTPLFLFPPQTQAPELNWPGRAVRRYHGRIPEFTSDLKAEAERGAVPALGQAALRPLRMIVVNSAGMAERVAELLHEYEVAAQIVPSAGAELTDGAVAICVGHLPRGFELPDQCISLQAESDLFDEQQNHAVRAKYKTATQHKKSRRLGSAAFLSDFRDLKVDDYVVHVDHGIARFGGLQTLEQQGRATEFVLLYYADESKLFVPVERLDLVQRFSSAEGRQPVLDRLGGLGWQKTKARAKRAMRDMADELLKLYAERKLVQGYGFSPDTPWQREFEETFPHTLTPDQETAIEDVKRDMEMAVPMDRLLCGDVGFGKTEVAMRAAFKAVMDGKQAVILAPTTVLAYQHYETLRARFAAFPAKIELLSRFRSTKEQKQVVERLEAGEVDVLVGTHRILSKDVKLKDLGLVVVDEEQRFGVAHKERLKQLRKRVDVLTLSATPIPRTLNMSLMGLRDMSVIETPPRDRLAIHTQVVQFSEAVIKSAIDIELARGGQVFFIHNRVETIDTIAALVQRLVPNARLVVGHGQMNEKQMEQVMLDFVAFKYDVLVATTIIENGIDIPRANTIIINRADHYGLSQLYQLRGRVGRSNRRAYAYMLIQSEQSLTPIARRRLAAIREFSDLGAGFRIAALDLELRGAGNLLGGQQSGHMEALGFDLYTQMLERTVAEVRGGVIQEEQASAINLGLDLAIPESYISDMGQRLRTYKRVSAARDDEALLAIKTETTDRYGRIPRPVERLFDYARLRRLAEEISVLSIDKTPRGFAVKLAEHARVDPARLLKLVEAGSGISFSPNGVLRVETGQIEEQVLLDLVRHTLLEIRIEG